MSKRREKISAFLDDDLHRDELMSFSLSAEADDAQVAQRYQMVGDTLRSEMSDSSFVDVSHAVREALADENIVNSMPASSMSASAASKDQKTSAFDWSSWLRPVAGMAVAASVAVVMVSVLSQQDETGIAPLADNTAKQQPVVQLATDERAAMIHTVGNKAASNKGIDLDPYINQHLEFATQDTLQGRLPYVRAVSFEPNKRVESNKAGQ